MICLKMKMLGMEQKVFVDSVAMIDEMYHLSGFDFNLSSSGYTIKVRGTKTGETGFDVEIRTGDLVQHRRIDVPEGVVLYSPMTDLAMRRLKPGQELTMQTVDPSTLSTIGLTTRALRREDLVVGEVEYRATVLSTEYQGVTILSWIDKDGRLLRQETPFGWTMEACEPEQAFESLDRSRIGSDGEG